jgi:hypothetical protein
VVTRIGEHSQWLFSSFNETGLPLGINK